MSKWAALRNSFYVILIVSAIVGILQMAGLAIIENNVLVIRINLEGWYNPAYVTAFSAVAGPALAVVANLFGFKVREKEPPA